MSLFTVILGISIISCLLYAFLIGIFTVGWFKLRTFPDKPLTENKRISVIIPFRNEEKHLPDLLDCIIRQTYPPQFLEFIFVDDHSTDKGPELITDLIEKEQLGHFTLLRLTSEDGFSKKAALKKGIEHSHGELIITTDADCIMGQSWLSQIVSFYNKEKCSVISAPVYIMPEKAFFSKLQSLEFMSLIGSGAGAISIRQPFLANGANLAFERKLYDELQGYSSNLNYVSGDDVFMLIKAKQKHEIRFLKNIESIVSTSAAIDLKTFLYQRIRWASKSKGYRDAVALITSLSVFMLNFILIVSLVLGLIDLHFLLLSGLIFILKALIDFPLMLSVSNFFKAAKLMWYYVPMQIFYPLYIVTTAFLSLFIPFEWKGRKQRQ